MTPLSAAKLYGAIQNQGANIGEAAKAASGGGDFGALVKTAIENSQSTTKMAEMQMTNHMAGRAELIDAVTAISSAETSLQSVVAIRDQVIQAYQEIMRMPI